MSSSTSSVCQGKRASTHNKHTQTYEHDQSTNHEHVKVVCRGALVRAATRRERIRLKHARVLNAAKNANAARANGVCQHAARRWKERHKHAHAHTTTYAQEVQLKQEPEAKVSKEYETCEQPPDLARPVGGGGEAQRVTAEQPRARSQAQLTSKR